MSTTTFSTIPGSTLLPPPPRRPMAREVVEEKERGQKLQMDPVHVDFTPWQVRATENFLCTEDRVQVATLSTTSGCSTEDSPTPPGPNYKTAPCPNATTTPWQYPLPQQQQPPVTHKVPPSSCLVAKLHFEHFPQGPKTKHYPTTSGPCPPAAPRAFTDPPVNCAQSINGKTPRPTTPQAAPLALQEPLQQHQEQ